MARESALASEITAVAKLLLGCLCAKLDEYERPACRCSRMSGDTAIADICEISDDGKNGQAWVRMTEVYPTDRFPDRITDYRCGGYLFAVEFELGILRCAVGSDEDGTPPSAKDLNLESDAMDIDAAILLHVAGCCLPPVFPRQISQWQPMSGGKCVGGRVTVSTLLVPGPHPGLGD